MYVKTEKKMNCVLVCRKEIVAEKEKVKETDTCDRERRHVRTGHSEALKARTPGPRHSGASEDVEARAREEIGAGESVGVAAGAGSPGGH